MTEQQVINCPKCGSNKVKENLIIKKVLIAAALIFFFIPVIGWIAGPIMALTAWSGNRAAKKKGIKPMKCDDCKNVFQVDEDKFVEFKKQIG
ncbi:hypothetical protein LC048_13505 [Mesobacillus subterraneus]|uniref:hypothetical protein n=1 Tax=Mesobacillus subterraneus TaxID=285983 RepID=UPI001CFC88A8|nr:hypothetical protein [Mesobacillus subterraneus]WLR53539.1 hypothetical protein LC048_13505 [Mesobacillus subterraneus]